MLVGRREFVRMAGSALTAGLSVAGLAGSSVGCRVRTERRPVAPPAVRLAMAFPPLSTRLAEEYRRALPDMEFQERDAVTSAQVLKMLQDGEVDVGVVLANEAYRTLVAESSAEPPESPVRGLTLLQPLPLYLLARSGLNVTGVAQLTGRRIGVSPPASSVSTLANRVLDAFGVPLDGVQPFTDRDEAATALRDRRLDAVMLPGFIEPDEILRAAIREGASLVPLEGPPIERLRRESPFVRVVMIPRDIYPGQDRIVPTIGMDLMVVCRRDLDEGLVFQLVDRFFNALPRLARVEATMRFLNIEEAPATPIPLHPGANRYFRTRELSR